MLSVEIFKESRQISLSGSSATEKFVYVVCSENGDLDEASSDFGEFWEPNDDIAAVNAVLSYFPYVRLMTDGAGGVVVLELDSIELNQISDGRWKVELNYILPQGQLTGGGGEYVKLSFSTKGNNIKITNSLQVMSADLATGIGLADVPDTGNLIGVTKDSVEGATVQGKGFNFEVTAYFESTIANFGYMNTIYHLSPSMNDAAMFGFAAGELLFLGMSGSATLYRRVPITFEFVASPNINGEADPGFPVLFALGHDIIDYRYYDTGDDVAGVLVKRPLTRYVHRVHPLRNLNLLGIPT